MLASHYPRPHVPGMFVITKRDAAAIAPPSIRAASCRPPLSCADCSLASPIAIRRAFLPGPSRLEDVVSDFTFGKMTGRSSWLK